MCVASGQGPAKKIEVVEPYILTGEESGEVFFAASSQRKQSAVACDLWIYFETFCLWL